MRHWTFGTAYAEPARLYRGLESIQKYIWDTFLRTSFYLMFMSAKFQVLSQCTELTMYHQEQNYSSFVLKKKKRDVIVYLN